MSVIQQQKCGVVNFWKISTLNIVVKIETENGNCELKNIHIFDNCITFIKMSCSKQGCIKHNISFFKKIFKNPSSHRFLRETDYFFFHIKNSNSYTG